MIERSVVVLRRQNPSSGSPPGEESQGAEEADPGAGVRPERRVVLAEDDPYMRTMLCSALERSGFSVIAVTDGLELVETVTTMAAQSSVPALIVSDVQMPGCTGLVALTRIRRVDNRVPVLLITAFGDEYTHAQAKNLSAAILDKPFDIYQFRTLVADLVRA